MQRAGFKKAASANGSDGAAGASGSTAKTSPFAASSTASAGDASAARAALYNARERTRETLIAAAAFALVVAFAITTHKIGATLWLALAARIAAQDRGFYQAGDGSWGGIANGDGLDDIVALEHITNTGQKLRRINLHPVVVEKSLNDDAQRHAGQEG